ncbi:MAG: hypothetical protein CL678_06650 [Bdellovibrionaceae bacterium]|nr:hypothetical protein [Pseudobdellovibrionaceae bacterium]|tara:strand:- start:3574 stop:4224 length:651 start_codon:yes stop_codon:yes gene_type:complete
MKILLGIAMGCAINAHGQWIQNHVKSSVFERVTKKNEEIAYADLYSLKQKKGYRFYTLFKARASLRRTREVLTNYSKYSEWIPRVKRSIYDPKTNILEIAGGIFGYELHSWAQMKEVDPETIEFKVVKGHFLGLTGRIKFEAYQGMWSLAYLEGEMKPRNWKISVPSFVLEKGAEIVLGFSSKKMRELIEAEVPQKGQTHGSEVPQPRKGRIRKNF